MIANRPCSYCFLLLFPQRYLPVDTLETGIRPVYFCSAYYIEMLLKAEVPLVFSAFHMSGFAPSQVIQFFTSQSSDAKEKASPEV